MKLIWHIILKDIVRDRAALLIWALYFVAQDAIGVFARNFTGITPEWVIGLQMTSAVLVFLQVSMGYMLVARLVQADLLIGTTMFWRTRPLSAGRLLTAKLLGAVLLFAVLPVLLLLPWWFYCQLTGREIFWAAIEMFGWQMLMIAPAFLVASLTDDLGRVLMWTLLFLIGLVSWIALLQAAKVRMPSDMLARPGMAVMFTRLWVCAMILIFGSLVIAAHQYLTRRAIRSVVLAVLGLGLMALTGELWSGDWLRTFASLHRPAPAAVDPQLLERVAFAVEPGRGTFSREFKVTGESGKTEASLQLKLRVTGLPDDTGIAVNDYLRHTFSWDNGPQLNRWSGYFWWNDSPALAMLRRTYSLPLPVPDPETIRWRKLRWDRSWTKRSLPSHPYIGPTSDVVLPGDSDSKVLRGWLHLPNSFLAKMKTEPPVYRAEGHWLLYRPEVAAELPLQAGAQVAVRGLTFHLRKTTGDKLLIISTRAAIESWGVWNSLAANGEFRNWFFRDRFMAVNRVTGDIAGVGDSQAGTQVLQVAGVIVTWNVLHVGHRMIIRDDKDIPHDPQWFEHTFLALVVDRDVGGFDRTVQTAKFALEPDEKDKDPGAAAP